MSSKERFCRASSCGRAVAGLRLPSSSRHVLGRMPYPGTQPFSCRDTGTAAGAALPALRCSAAGPGRAQSATPWGRPAPPYMAPPGSTLSAGPPGGATLLLLLFLRPLFRPPPWGPHNARGHEAAPPPYAPPVGPPTHTMLPSGRMLYQSAPSSCPPALRVDLPRGLGALRTSACRICCHSGGITMPSCAGWKVSCWQLAQHHPSRPWLMFVDDLPLRHPNGCPGCKCAGIWLGVPQPGASGRRPPHCGYPPPAPC